MNKNRNDLTEKEGIALIEGNFFSLWDAFGVLPGVEYSKKPETVSFISGIPYPLCNDVIHACFGGGDAEKQIVAALVPFEERKLPMFWWVGPSTQPANLGTLLKAHGLVFVEDVVGMAVNLREIEDAVPHHHGLIIDEVKDGDALHVWSQVFGKGFEIPEVAVSFFRDALERIGMAPQSPYKHYVGTLHGVPVGCSSVYISHGVAGIYNVTTLPEAQRKRIGAALTLRPLLDAREKGCLYGILQSTQAGLNLYKRLGFREYCTLSIYMREAAERGEGTGVARSPSGLIMKV
jgi:ribosomal protein S18 acetylase RimI-like enzyme